MTHITVLAGRGDVALSPWAPLQNPSAASMHVHAHPTPAFHPDRRVSRDPPCPLTLQISKRLFRVQLLFDECSEVQYREFCRQAPTLKRLGHLRSEADCEEVPLPCDGQGAGALAAAVFAPS